MINVNEYIFPVIYLKAIHLTGQNDWPTEILSGQMVISKPDIVHCPLSNRYFEPYTGHQR